MSKINLEIGVLNIAMHNHDKGALSYKNLFYFLHNEKIDIKIDDTHRVYIGELNTEKEYGNRPYFIGMLYKYAKIDPEKECLNTETNEEATSKEKEALKTPDNLRPHIMKIPFIFIPNGHRFYIRIKHKKDSFGITKAKRFLEKLFQHEKVIDQFGDVEVTIEPDSLEIERLLNRKDISKLTLDIVRPNPDDFKIAEKNLFDKMEKRKLRKQRIEYSSIRNENLHLDSELQDEIRIASCNGKVVAEGIDSSDTKWKTSTEEINLIVKTDYISERNEENKGKDFAEEKLIEIAFDTHNKIV
ncbi:DUF4747 family protein [Pasteurella atlantica]|uniref:DUF4747 family protein n=1 Tax=Pasteurellaceae TaxID=712 RepID=UPI00274EE17B|nr:DUF4747 family protein [Pasteurella atlantica]MDP8098315.1 DUF4747 family protein [Pasteurella atlantica]MDP8106593.1 DUF4747 family protein [Pasteurella atlantica]MDP8116118.1 DUF4747 family protein [Pasteurella atlantica]